MKKRIFALLLASFVLVSTTVCSYVETRAASTTGITWTDELLYAFELFLNSSGVRVTSRAVPGVALAWEAQARLNNPEFMEELEEYQESITWWGQDSEGYQASLCNQWITSIRDFFASDACTDYGTADFSFGTSLTSQILDMMGITSAELDDYLSSYCGYPIYVGVPGSDIYGYDNAELVSIINSGVPYRIVTRLSSLGNILITGIYFGEDMVYEINSSGNTAISFSDFSEYKSYSFIWDSKDVFVPSTSKYGYSSATIGTSSPCGFISPGLKVQFASTGESYLASVVSGFGALLNNAGEFVGLQVKALTDVPTLSDIFTIPETAAEREEVLAKVREADTTEALVKALSDAGVVTGLTDVVPDTDIDIDTETYPWLDSVVKALSAILAGIKAIPVQTADFLTVDLKAISAAFDILLEALDSRFPLLKQLAAMFSYDGKSFDQTPPVFTIQVPDCLRFAYPTEDEIIILDMRIHASYYAMARLLLNAFIWLMFANWVIDEFDIDFHVG